MINILANLVSPHINNISEKQVNIAICTLKWPVYLRIPPHPHPLRISVLRALATQGNDSNNPVPRQEGFRESEINGKYLGNTRNLNKSNFILF